MSSSDANVPITSHTMMGLVILFLLINITYLFEPLNIDVIPQTVLIIDSPSHDYRIVNTQPSISIYHSYNNGGHEFI